MSTQPKAFITPEQYLDIERRAEYRSEYFHGEVFAMAGAQEAHSILAGNLMREFNQQVRQKPCRVYSNDMRVHVPSTGLYTYPDIVAVCGERQFIDSNVDTLLNPNLIVEVLSPSTEAYDRGRKFERYRAVTSLTEYLLIASDRVHAELFTRNATNWVLSEAKELENEMEIASIGCRLKLADIYEKVDFAGA